MSSLGRITHINRFPFKSMQGEALDVVEVDEGGIKGDRTWALRDVDTNKIVSAKRPSLWRELLNCTATGVGDQVKVTLPDYSQWEVTDPGLEEALSKLFGRGVKIELATQTQQGVYASDWPEIEGLSLSGEVDIPINLAGQGTSFVDVSALHFITSASLLALSSLVPETGTDLRRFRPSLVIETKAGEGFIENDWEGKSLLVGEVQIEVGIPTPRCVMPTLAQGELSSIPEVLRSLAANNRVTSMLGTFASLGSYASVTQGGTIHVGDEVRFA